jgi:predicted dehydrogenase
MNLTKKPILIIGLGSVGRRHLQNLLTLGVDNIILYRTGKSTLPDSEFNNFKTFDKLEEALESEPIGVIVANPTSLHVSTAITAAKAGCHILMEKPVSHTLEDISDLRKIVKANNLQFVTGYQFRFHPALRKIKAWLEAERIGAVISAQAHWGEDVTNWHPGENYSKSYSVRAELGGGVALTLSHPFDYLRWFFGDVDKLYAVTGNSESLQTNADAIMQIAAKFKNGVIGDIYLDYIEKPTRHTLSLIGERGTIHWDNGAGGAKLFNGDKCVEEYKLPPAFERNTMFLSLMGHFLKCIEGAESPACTLDDGIADMKIALAAKQSALDGKERVL